MVSSAYLRLLIFLLEILIPACDSSSLEFHKMYSAYNLNKQGDNIQPWSIPFLIRNQSIFLWPVLNVASWPANRFHRRQVGSVQFSSSVASNSLWPHGSQHSRLPSLSITNSRSLLKLMPIELVMPSNHFILCHPLLLPTSIFTSIRVFPNESLLHIRWPEFSHWSFPLEFSHLFKNISLLFPSFSKFSTVCCDPHSQRLWHSQ